MYVLEQFFAFVVFILILGVIALIGEAIIGSENKGGARLVVFSLGGFLFYIATLFIRDIPSIFAIIFSILFGALGLFFMAISVFASSETIEKVANDIIGGI